MEKKHEKIIMKLQNDLMKYKRRYEQQFATQNNDLNNVLTQPQSIDQVNPNDPLRAS